MKHRIEFGSGPPQDVTLETFGPASRDGILSLVRDLVGDPCFRRDMSILVDHSALDSSPLKSADLRAQAELVASLEERFGHCHIAIVVPDQLTFAYARMYELHAAETRIHSHVFYSRDDGLSWLETQQTEHAS